MSKKPAVLVCFLMVALLLFPGCGGAGPKEVTSKNLKKVSEFEGGYLYRSGRLNIVQMYGDYEEMGRQYGGLMKSQMKEVYQKMVEGDLAKSAPMSTLSMIAQDVYSKYPERIRRILDGIEQTSGLSSKEVKLVDTSLLLGVALMVAPQCSTIAAWDGYTTNGDAVMGRNFDYLGNWKEVADTLTLAVYNPDDGSCPAATLGFAGQVATYNSFNAEKLALEMHAGSFVEMNFPRDRIPLFADNLCFMLDSPDFTTLDAFIKSTRTTFPFVVDVATSKEVYCYEDAQERCVRHQGEKDGLLVITNHYLDPSWVIPPEAMQFMDQDFWQNTTTRLQNLTNLGERNKGKIDAEVMKKIMDTPMDQGGATVPGTVIQFVVVPAEQDLWVKGPGYSEWDFVELDKFFYEEEPKK